MVRMTSKKSLAILGLLTVAFGYSVLGVNSRLLSQGFEPMTQVYVRIVLGFLLSLILFRKKLRLQQIKTAPLNDWFWLGVMGVVGYALNVWMITLANLNAKLVNSAVIYATIPFIVYAYSFFLLKEKIKPKLIFFLAIALYGITVVTAKSFLPQLDSFGIGELFALLSVFSGGWWSVGIKKLSSHLNHQEITSLTMLIAAVAGFVIAMGKGEALTWQSFYLPRVILGLVIGAFLNVILTFFENFSFKYLDIVFGNQLLMTSTLFSLALGFIFYHEVVSIVEILGAGLIVFSVWQANKLLK